MRGVVTRALGLAEQRNTRGRAEHTEHIIPCAWPWCPSAPPGDHTRPRARPGRSRVGAPVNMFDGMLDALAGVDWYTTLALCVACSFLLSRAALTPHPIALLPSLFS